MMRKQIIGIVSSLAAFLVLTIVLGHANQLFSSIALPIDDTASRLAFAVRWLIIPGATLLVGIVGAARRGFFVDAIDGTRTPANHALEINLRYNLNTLEQTVLAAIAWIGLALALPHDRLILIPAMAVLFALGRLTFWIGYLIYPIARAFGMVLTIVPTLAAYGWLGWRVLGQ